jgi:hypothetical protein
MVPPFARMISPSLSSERSKLRKIELSWVMGNKHLKQGEKLSTIESIQRKRLYAGTVWLRPLSQESHVQMTRKLRFSWPAKRERANVWHTAEKLHEILRSWIPFPKFFESMRCHEARISRNLLKASKEISADWSHHVRSKLDRVRNFSSLADRSPWNYRLNDTQKASQKT